MVHLNHGNMDKQLKYKTMNQQITYKYSKIDLEQFAMFEENYDASVNEVQFQTDIQFSFDKSNNVMCSKIIITASQTDKPVLKACLCSYFEIESDSVKVLIQDNKIVFTQYLLIQFSSLCYGTMRGVIHAKTIGSPLNSFILPPIYMDKVIDKAFVVAL